MAIAEAIVKSRYNPNRDVQTSPLSQIPELMALQSEMSRDMLTQGTLLAAQVICVSSA